MGTKQEMVCWQDYQMIWKNILKITASVQLPFAAAAQIRYLRHGLLPEYPPFKPDEAICFTDILSTEGK